MPINSPTTALTFDFGKLPPEVRQNEVNNLRLGRSLMLSELLTRKRKKKAPKPIIKIPKDTKAARPKGAINVAQALAALDIDLTPEQLARLTPKRRKRNASK